MKILHLCAADESTGAGKATLLTHSALLQLGVDSRVLFLKSNINEPFIFSFHNAGLKNSLKRLIVTSLERMPILFYPKRKSQIFSTGWIGLRLSTHPLIQWADIIHIHWANHGFVDIKEIRKWEKPVVWTLRDMWAFTGGCHHAFECIRYSDKCGICPLLNSKKINDPSYRGLQRKNKYLKPLPIIWVAISSWIKEKAEKSIVLRNKNIQIIPSGINSKIFKVLSKEKTRYLLNIPLNKKVILIGAANIREKYKGFEFVVSTLNMVDKDNLVLTFGAESFKDKEIPQQFIHFGFLTNEKLTELYAVSDVFLAPSIAEAMGKTFLEAQFCGLPVVCFEKTGPADIIKHKETGYLAKFESKKDLIKGINYSINKNWNRSYIRTVSVQMFDIKKIAKDYIKIYEKSIMDWGSL